MIQLRSYKLQLEGSVQEVVKSISCSDRLC